MSSSSDPFSFFGDLFERARAAVKGRDFNGMTVATVDERGRPSARVVLLKDFDARGFVFYTNHNSRKGRDLIERPFACLVFYWPELEYQVRIDGEVHVVSDEEADAYFRSRPRGSQLGAWASKQSDTLPDREELLERYRGFEKKYEGKDVPRPPHWGGFRLVPTSIEFWKNEPSRLHQRTLFERASESAPWTQRLLYP